MIEGSSRQECERRAATVGRERSAADIGRERGAAQLAVAERESERSSAAGGLSTGCSRRNV